MIDPTRVDYILRVLRRVLEVSSFSSDMEDRCHELIHELEYLKAYVWCLAKWNDSSFGRDKNFVFVEESQIKSLAEAFRMSRVSRWDLASELLEQIQQCKPKIKEDCLNFLDCPFQCEFSSDDLPEFMRSISTPLHQLPHLKADMILDVKVKIESLADNLDLFKEVFEFAAKRCSSPEDLKDFKIRIQAWACRAACLSLLYWVLDVKKENMAPRMDVILSDLQSSISPSTPEVTRMYLAVLKASKPSAKDGLAVGKLIMKFVEFLKDNLQVDPDKDDIQMLFIELIFLTTFLMDRPEAMMLAEGELILTQADAVVNEIASLISSLSSGEINGGIDKERNFLLQNILAKAEAVKAEVRKIYAHLFFDPSSFNFPTINVLEFIDSLLESLKDFCFHFPKRQMIMMLQQKLLSLKESNLKDFSVLELQNKHTDIKDLWIRIVNVAYNAERAVCSFIYMGKSLWHDILCLSDVIEEVKHIRDEVKRIQDQHIYDIQAVNSEISPNTLLPLQVNLPMMDEVVVGFKVEVKEILGRLIGGSPELDIISIVGMPGLGKTTLAKKVCSDASVRSHFHKYAWCSVSQTFNSKRMLLDIVSGLNVCGRNDLSTMEEGDLAQRVYQCLKGDRYLIVLDDIWDVSAWEALKMSFPEDNNGSRIMFTSRIHTVISEAKSDCSPFPLNPLSEEESWELLEEKLFGQDGCSPDFVDIGKSIAIKCKGLPLGIVVIAGLLKEKLERFSWWKQVEESLDKSIAKEGCWDLLELSYKHLPELLRPCFLYLASFAEDAEIRVKKLTLLWISEGFIKKHENKSLEVVAEEYLMDLVGRSLVIVTKRSSTGGIKACGVHDLWRDFCIAKGEEEKVFKVIRGNEVSYMADPYAHYRVCFQTECWRSFLEHVPPVSSVHSFLSLHPLPKTDSEPKYIQFLTSCYFKFLHVLELALPIYGSLEEITELVLLRYLAIQCYSEVIPPSIKMLKNLETLYLKNWSSFRIPVTMWEMQKLRHIYISSTAFPSGFYDNSPPLENVQTFSHASLSFGEAEILWRKIPNVRKLKCALIIVGVDPRTGILKWDFLVNLDFLSHLESLSLGLSMEDYFYELTDWAFCFPSTLKKLSLQKFALPWSKISLIAKLPNLEVLKLDEAFCGKTWNVGDEEFLKLKFLRLRNLDIEQLNAFDDSFPCLEHLELFNCTNLKEVPSRFGSILTLKMIEVTGFRSTLLISLRKIHVEQVDLGNEHMELLVSGPIYKRSWSNEYHEALREVGQLKRGGRFIWS